MSPKELLYIEDALTHAQFLQQQCTNAANQVQDPHLNQCLTTMAEKHRQTFQSFISLV